jgi:hypothetical protein
MFIHWGLYAIPAGIWHGKTVVFDSHPDREAPGEWIMNLAKIPVADYSALAKQFDPTKFDADAWVSLAKAYMLADPVHTPLKLIQNGTSVTVSLPASAPDPIASVLVLEAASGG